MEIKHYETTFMRSFLKRNTTTQFIPHFKHILDFTSIVNFFIILIIKKWKVTAKIKCARLNKLIQLANHTTVIRSTICIMLICCWNFKNITFYIILTSLAGDSGQCNGELPANGEWVEYNVMVSSWLLFLPLVFN